MLCLTNLRIHYCKYLWILNLLSSSSNWWWVKQALDRLGFSLCWILSFSMVSIPDSWFFLKKIQRLNQLYQTTFDELLKSQTEKSLKLIPICSWTVIVCLISRAGSTRKPLQPPPPSPHPSFLVVTYDNKTFSLKWTSTGIPRFMLLMWGKKKKKNAELKTE